MRARWLGRVTYAEALDLQRVALEHDATLSGAQPRPGLGQGQRAVREVDATSAGNLGTLHFDGQVWP